MTTYRIGSSSEEDVRYVWQKLVEFNVQEIPESRYEPANFCLKNDSGAIIAGLNGSIKWNWMEVDILWVSEEYRGQGLGSKLLKHAEELALSKNCTLIKLHTFSFQAPLFYEKMGYRQFAFIPNAPIGYNQYYFVKELTDNRID